MTPVDPGPRPADDVPDPGPPPPPSGPGARGAAGRAPRLAGRLDAADVGGWRSTLGQGLVLARWTAAELVAQRIDGFAWIAWAAGATGLALFGLSVPVDPGWPLIALGVLLVAGAVVGRLGLAIAAWIVRRLALPRRARHLRGEVSAARGRLTDAVAAAGIPVSPWAALRFVVALALGRKPHAGVAGRLKDVALHLDEVAEVHRLRQALYEAATPTGGAPGGSTADPDGR